MIPLSEARFQQRLRRLPAIHAIPRERGDLGQKSFEQVLPIKQRFDRVRRWRERLSPDFRRACSAGQLFFQIVGVAGYAGYFASMHTFMRLLSGALMAGAWYAIYKIKN
jgi:hypothetical protein